MQTVGLRSRVWRLTALAIIAAVMLAACGTPVPSGSTPAVDTAVTTSPVETRPAGWSAESHGNEADPNYAVVFPQDQVNEIAITIAPEDWSAMQADITELMGEPGQGGGFGGFGGPPDGGDNRPPFDFEGTPPVDGNNGAFDGPPGGGGRGGDMTPTNPMWVPATVEFNGETWTDVGVRYKGNSSLRSTWSSGSLKLPLKLDFDEFEDENPEISNQRFYGFKQLSLANGFGDDTYLREMLTYDLLEAAGLVAAETAHYHVTLDYGEGPVSLGLYVAVEVIDDTVVERVFGDDSGNIYKPEGGAASLAEGTFGQIEASFQKQNNEAEGDWSDIEALYNVLHSDLRSTDPAAWRVELEAVFDVDGFLEWLALSAAIQHWDSYGGMPHNYYLFSDPDTGRLTWISWDHNLTLGGSFGPGGGGGPGNGGGGFGGGRGGGMFGRNSSLDRADIGSNWPLIRYLLDDPTYYAAYLGHLESAGTLLDANALMAQYEATIDFIAPYVAQEGDSQAFEAAVQELSIRIAERAEAVAEFLATQ